MTKLQSSCHARVTFTSLDFARWCCPSQLSHVLQSRRESAKRFHASLSKAQQDGLSKGKPGSFQKAERNVRLEEMHVADY
jgi:hypothetical protein